MRLTDLFDLNLAILVSYFGLIGWCLYLCLISALSPPPITVLTSPRTSASQRGVMVFTVISILSLLTTWTHMLRYLAWSFHNWEQNARLQGLFPPRLDVSMDGWGTLFERVRDWLRGTSLFTEAWLEVVSGEPNWWWSAHVCALTCGLWTVQLYVESRRLAIRRPWAFMALGQIVAVSFAQSLFHLAMFLRDTTVSLSDPLARAQLSHSPTEVAVPSAKSTSSPSKTKTRKAAAAGTVTPPPSSSSVDSVSAHMSPPAASTVSTVTVSDTIAVIEADPDGSKMPWILTVSVAAGLGMVALGPDSLAKVLVMHVFPILPLIPSLHHHPVSPTTASMSRLMTHVLSAQPSMLYLVSAVASLLLHARNTYSLVRSLPETPMPTLAFVYALWHALRRHPAQSSIGWDSICCALSTSAFIVLDRATQREANRAPVRKWIAATLALATPFLGPAATGSFYMAVRERALEVFAEEAEAKRVSGTGGKGPTEGRTPAKSRFVIHEKRTVVESMSPAKAD